MGYVNDTAMSQFIPPTAFHCVTGTWTLAAGQVAGTIVKIKSANAETSVINIPIMIPSNSVALKGGYLKSVEVDYEIRTAACTTLTATMNKVVRGADGVDAAPANVPVTQDLTAATDAADVDEHKLTVTITTPFWIDNDEYVLLVITAVCAAGTVLEFLGAVANFTLRA
jgi:hypothetical protein